MIVATFETDEGERTTEIFEGEEDLAYRININADVVVGIWKV